MDHETHSAGRKGVAYDWQSIYAAAHAESLDDELVALLSAAAPSA